MVSVSGVNYRNFVNFKGNDSKDDKCEKKIPVYERVIYPDGIWITEAVGEKVGLKYENGTTGITDDGRVINLIPNSLEYGKKKPEEETKKDDEPEDNNYNLMVLA